MSPSMQPIGDRICFGDEFGPYIFATDVTGRVVAFSETMVDERHIIVGNDNNLPFSTGRAIGRADDNELILLDVGTMVTQP